MGIRSAIVPSLEENATPTCLGYRMPAEWEAHQGTWFSWPHNTETWPDELDRVESAIAQAVKALAPHETVHLNVNDAAHERHVRGVLDAVGVRGDVKLHPIPTNDAWIRDHGAIFVVRETENHRALAATDWGFNSWGGKYPPWDDDDRAPDRMARALDVPRFAGGMILEGGSIDVNGAGALLTTEQCLLNPNRNPGLTRGQIEARLRDYLGVQDIFWLSEGIAGDDTDGHVDDVTRFVNTHTVVTVVEDDRHDENYPLLQENLERLHAICFRDGGRLNVVTLPMPRPVGSKGDRMPASYANFYVANSVVLASVYDDPNDARALATLKRLFPAREIVPIDCRDVIWGLGAIHCLTQQVPAV